MYDIMYHHCGLEEWYDHRNMSAWETSQWLQCTLDPCCVYTIVTLAWCSNQVVPCTVYMHTIGYDNNVSPYSSNVSTRLYTCTCTGMQMCGHIPAVRTGLNHTCV